MIKKKKIINNLITKQKNFIKKNIIHFLKNLKNLKNLK